jgi:hypothetical protein
MAGSRSRATFVPFIPRGPSTNDGNGMSKQSSTQGSAGTPEDMTGVIESIPSDFSLRRFMENAV